MKAVKFLMPYTLGALYNEGEVAGFDDDSQWGWRVAVTKLDVDESNADYVHEGTP